LRELIRSLLFLSVVLLPVVSPAQQPTSKRQRTVVPEARMESWKSFSSAEGSFSIDFPGSPTLSTEEANTPAGKFVLHKCSVSTLAQYGVMYSDYPMKKESADEANKLLNDGAKAAVANLHSELLSLAEITVQGNLGRLLKERMHDGSIMYAKMILVGSRLYQIAVTLPRKDIVNSEPYSVYEDAASRFLDSFKLMSTDETEGEFDRWLRDNGGRDNRLASRPLVARKCAVIHSSHN